MSDDLFAEYPFSVPVAAVRPPDEPAGADRALAANVLGTLALTLEDRISLGVRDALGRGAHAPAALVVLLWYPDRPMGISRRDCASVIRCSAAGAAACGRRLGGAHPWRGRSYDAACADPGGRAGGAGGAGGRARGARPSWSRRSPIAGVRAFLDTASAMLEALTDDLLTGESMRRMCDELACPDERCPVERAEPAPPARRGLGYGVTA